MAKLNFCKRNFTIILNIWVYQKLEVTSIDAFLKHHFITA